jgi:glycosyltransferase involved in cell wall biosynthesis
MGHLSIIIPYCVEPYLDKTINSLKESASGDIEILPIEGSKGHRAAINEGLVKAKGDWIMKLDAHCLVCPGFDKIVDECEKNWVVVPSRYSVSEETWTRDEKGLVRDYHYLSFPTDSPNGHTMLVQQWLRKDRKEFVIDDVMTFQGSCWIANREYFMKRIGLLDVENYGQWAHDQVEIGMKYWLGGDAVKVNKKFWYAHLQKRPHHYHDHLFSRKYKRNDDAIKGYEWGTKHWMNNEEPNMKYTFQWFIDKFMPIPTWTDDRSLWE